MKLILSMHWTQSLRGPPCGQTWLEKPGPSRFPDDIQSQHLLLSLSIMASSAQFLLKHHIHYQCQWCLHSTLPSARPQFLHCTYKVVPILHPPTPEFIDVHLQSTKLWEVISDQNGLYEESSDLQLEHICLLQRDWFTTTKSMLTSKFPMLSWLISNPEQWTLFTLVLLVTFLDRMALPANCMPKQSRYLDFCFLLA